MTLAMILVALPRRLRNATMRVTLSTSVCQSRPLYERTAKRPNRLFIRSDDWQDQIVQVLDDLELWDEVRPNTRCLACNLPLKPLSRERARNLVTPYVCEKAASFAICPGCDRVFWQGTHYGDMEKKIEKILERRGRSITG